MSPLFNPPTVISASNSTFANTVRITGGPNITVGTDASGVTLSGAAAGGAQTAISGIAASNTTYTSGTVTITGVGGGITVSSNTGQRVDLSVAAPVAQTTQTQNFIAASATNTLYTSGTVTFTGSNMVTVKSSAAGQGIIFDATQSAQPIGSFGQSNIGNSSGDTGVVTGRLVLAGGNNITLSGSTNAGSETITISAGAGGGAAPNLFYFDPAGGVSSDSVLGSRAFVYNTLILAPLTPFNEIFPGNMTARTAMLNISHVGQTATASSSSFTSSMLLGIYTLQNSTQLSLLNSASATLSRSAATANTSVVSGSGYRWWTIHSTDWSASPTFSQTAYWYAMIARSSNFNFPATSAGQFIGQSFQRQGTFGTSNATATSMKHYPFMGIHSVSKTAFPVTIQASEINAVHSLANWLPHIVFNDSFSVL